MTRPISEYRGHLAAILTYASDKSPHPKAWPADDADLALHEALDELEQARAGSAHLKGATDDVPAVIGMARSYAELLLLYAPNLRRALGEELAGRLNAALSSTGAGGGG